MKKILFAAIAALLCLALAACTSGGGNEATTVPSNTERTTRSEEEIRNNNMSVLARIGFEELMNYVNLSEAYGVEIPIGENDTVGDIIAFVESEGGALATNNIRSDARFFDYVKLNPDAEKGSGKYILRDDVNWIDAFAE